MDDLRLQLDIEFDAVSGDYVDVFRFARDNGWHCGHWHRTSEEAAVCIKAKHEGARRSAA